MFQINNYKYLNHFRVDAEFSAKAKIQMLTDGTTAIVAVIHDGKIYVANAGDSRAMLVQKGGKFKVMSIDHRPDRKDEEERFVLFITVILILYLILCIIY